MAPNAPTSESNPPTLDDLGQRHNTDKAAYWVRPDGVHDPAHDYLRHYEKALGHLRGKSFTLLDLGAGFEPNHFASAMMWAEYFPGARVVAVDIQEGLHAPHGDILFEQVDLSRIENLLRLAREYRPTVVVEDASHVWAHQMLSFFYLFPSLEPGGVYIWEDLNTGGPTMQQTFSQGYPFSPADLMAVLVQKVLLRDEPQADDGPRTLRSVTEASAEHEQQLVGAFGPLVDATMRLVDSLTVVPRSVIFHRILPG
jgi:hypothetical protein